MNHKSVWLNREHKISLHSSREYVAILCDGYDFNYWTTSQIADDPQIGNVIARNVAQCCLYPEQIARLTKAERDALGDDAIRTSRIDGTRPHEETE